MTPLPTTDLRSNRGTWAVPAAVVPSVARQLLQSLPIEKFDPDFQGQDLQTTYFDTRTFALRKARRNKDRYLTFRIRCYQPGDTYALSAKTESAKFRREIDHARAEMFLENGIAAAFWPDLLPADLIARLQELIGDELLQPIVTVGFRRFAVENPTDRFTLDLDVRTDTGKCFPTNVLEYKSTQADPAAFVSVPLRPIKLSKFLWATS
jgi:hypothetical protein